MRRSAALLALLVSACSSHHPGTATLSPPTPASPASASPAATRSLSPTPARTSAASPRVVPRTTAPQPSAQPSPTRSRTPSPRAPKTWALTISGFAFDPDTPSIRVGDSIRVTNLDPDTHTFTARNGSFDSGDLDQHQSATLRFTKVGVFDVVCSYHATMTGQVVVSA